MMDSPALGLLSSALSCLPFSLRSYIRSSKTDLREVPGPLAALLDGFSRTETESEVSRLPETQLQTLT